MGDKPPVSRPYRHDRVKQGIIDYHVEKMLREDLCETLYQIKQKFKTICWLEETLVAFESITQATTEAPVLKLPDFNMQFELFTDASSIGIGAGFTQEQRPIANANRTLNNAERNYTVSERECLVVIWTLNKFRTYLGPLPVKMIIVL
ncbi:hypothetical protein TNCV_2412481 [Trichonephila clavipes]|nr:hypothetical protein TNCV_2412481 [Trichonephila clavipes]